MAMDMLTSRRDRCLERRGHSFKQHRVLPRCGRMSPGGSPPEALPEAEALTFRRYRYMININRNLARALTRFVAKKVRSNGVSFDCKRNVFWGAWTNSNSLLGGNSRDKECNIEAMRIIS